MTTADGQAAAYVGVGSNLAPRENLLAALRMLREMEHVTAVSTVYRTRPLGPDGTVLRGRPDFLNAVFELHTSRGPDELKRNVLRPVEARLGRRRGEDRFAPRTIDLDLLFHAGAGLDAAGPGAAAAELLRPFVLVPLLELAPDLVPPGSRQPLCCLWPGGIPAGMAPEAECTRLLKEILQG